MSPLRLLLSFTLACCFALLLAPVLADPMPIEPDGGIGDGAGPIPQEQQPEAEQDADEPAEDKEKQPTLTDLLGGEDRYLTHLATDKPIYREGEKVYLRGTILHAFTRTPLEDNTKEIEKLGEQIDKLHRAEPADDEARQAQRQEIRRLAMQQNELISRTRIMPMVEIKDPKGATISSGRTQVQDSVFGFAWEVPEGQAGGEYTVKVSYPMSGLSPVERTFDIRAYRAPRIRSQIDFVKDGYGPGDTVIATLDATRAEGGVPEGAKVTAIARVDGAEVARVETTFNAAGTAEARFELPGEIERGEGSLAFVIEDGGVVETASKTIPILLQTVDLQLYPEGGDLVAGVENRVYFEARTPFGKPADIKGVVEVFVDGNVDLSYLGVAPGEEPWLKLKDVHFQTTHEGRGIFSFTPQADINYRLRVTEPSSVTQTFELPEAKSQGLVLHTYHDSDMIGLRPTFISTDLEEADREQEKVRFVVRQREHVVAQLLVPEQMLNGKTPVVFWREGDPVPSIQGPIYSANIHSDVSGILTVTAYDAKGNPLAERLVYRAPKEHVNIEVLPNSAQYTPGGKVSLTIKTTDGEGNPISAVAGLTVTDDAVLEMIETREQAPALPAMVFLEPEVRELADAHVYLDPNNPDAAEQLDLLLGTQGWRRFALVDLPTFIREHGDDARRALAFRRPVAVEREKMLRREAMRFNAVPMAAAAGPAPEADALEDGAVNDEVAVQEQAPADPQAPPANEPVAGEELDQALNEAQEAQEGQALIAGDIAEPAARPARRAMPEMVFIREYAHKQPAGKAFGERSDFTETVYWSATTKTNEQGMATVEFDLSDSVTSFRVKADAFTPAGALGAGTGLIESVRPFYIEPKLPLELTAGDKVLLPIAMVNATDRELPVELTLSKLGQAGKTKLDPIAVGADERGRWLHEMTIGESYGDLPFVVTAKAGNLFDENKRSLRVVPRGFPIDDGSGGMLQPDSQVEDEIIIPETIIPGSLVTSITVYPTPMANLTEALEALIRDPYGCFEQTSSTTFPLVMAQQYFLSHQGIDPKLIAAAQEKLDAGYKRLISFETEKNGYEWFGSTPPHEALTAYGLLQFNEMKQVMDVDQAMIDRTQNWLMSRMDEEGSFKLDDKALDSFGRAPQDTTNAYIVWSLLEAGYDPAKIQKSIDLVLKKATEGEDAYIIALGANIAQLAYDKTEVLKIEDGAVDASQVRSDEYLAMAKLLREKLSSKLTDEGFVDGAVTSITNSGGDSLNIETTSLAILAWLKDDAYTPQVEKSMLWLTERCKAGSFGSTQSTVLALKAIVEYDKARSTPKAPGSLVLTVDGERAGEPIAFDQDTKGAIKLHSVLNRLTPGKHTIGIEMIDGSKMPYTIAVEYHAEKPASSDECKLRIETSFPPANRIHLSFEGSEKVKPHYAPVVEGETTEVNVKITNITKDGMPTPIAIVGIPGGLEPSYDQLKELVDSGTIASFEVIGRDVVLYWREMKPEQVVELSIRCVAAVPGTYTGPASRTYLYYTNEHKHWADGLTVNITPRDTE